MKHLTAYSLSVFTFFILNTTAKLPLDIMGLPLLSSTGLRSHSLSKFSSAERMASMYSEIKGYCIFNLGLQLSYFSNKVKKRIVDFCTERQKSAHCGNS